MKKIFLLILISFLATPLPALESTARKKSLSLPTIETTLSLYCFNTLFAADLDDQTALFWGHHENHHFPSLLENKFISKIINLSPHLDTLHIRSAFTALLTDQTLICWGNKNYGGLLPTEMAGQHVSSVVATAGAFAAILKDGSVQAWGHIKYGGRIPEALSKKLRSGHRVLSIASTDKAFTALLNDGTICSWGDPYHGGKSPSLENVTAIVANHFAFTAILKNGTVVSWCNSDANDYTSPNFKGDSIQAIVTTDQMFSALLKSGKIISWSFKSNEVVSPTLKPGEHALSIAAHHDEFTAYLDSGRVILWNGYDRDSASFQTSPSPSQTPPSILVSDTCFALLPEEGDPFSWKSVMDNKGTHSVVDFFSHATDLLAISATPGGFCTLLKDNQLSLLTWLTNEDLALEETLLTPTLPPTGRLTSLYTHCGTYSSQQFPIVLPSDQVTLLENPSSNQGEWQYQSKKEWLLIPILPDFERPNGFTLTANTKIRFVPSSHYTGDIPELTLQRQ